MTTLQNCTPRFAAWTALACFLTGWASAQTIVPATNPRMDFPVTDGTLKAVLVDNGVVYIGGDFDFVNPSRGSGVAYNLAMQTPMEFPAINGTVHAVAPDGSGGWFIGGSFTEVGSEARLALAHVRADLTVNPEWDAAIPNGHVNALAVRGDTLYVGGLFWSIGGESRQHLAALDARTGQATSWYPGPAEFTVNALALAGNTLFAGGNFTAIGEQSRRRLAAFEARTGDLKPWNPGANGEVRALAMSDCATLYVGGAFTEIAGQDRRGLAALDTFDGEAGAWNPSPLTFFEDPGEVYALAVARDGVVYAGGFFHTIGGKESPYLAALDPFTGFATDWNPHVNGLVYSLAAVADTIYAGGSFNLAGGLERRDLAALQRGSGLATEWNPNSAGTVFALGVSDGVLYAGGEVTQQGVPRKSLAALDAYTGEVLDWAPQIESLSALREVTALAIHGSTLYIGGNFSSVGPFPRSNLAAIDTISGLIQPWDPQALGSVNAIVATDSAIYLGGWFQTVGEATRNYLAAVHPISGEPTEWNPAPDGAVSALAVQGNSVFIGGWFQNVGGTPRQHLAAVDLATGAPTSWIAPANGEVKSILPSGNTVYVGGLFTEIGGLARAYIAALDATTGAGLDWNPGASGTVESLAEANGILFAGGAFTYLADQFRQGLAALDAETGTVLAWAPLPGSVNVVAVAKDTVYAGGFFRGAANRFRPSLAAFPPPTAPSILHEPQSVLLRPGQITTLSAEVTGAEPLYFQWQFFGDDIPNANSPVLTIDPASSGGAGVYTLVVTNEIGRVQSVAATVTLFQPVEIQFQPFDQVVEPGEWVALEVLATGSPEPRYQWRRNGVNIPGEIGSFLILPNPQPEHSGTYSVVVANAGGAISSLPASLVVTSPPLLLSDELANRMILADASGLGSGENVIATTESGEPLHAGRPGGKSVWIGWLAPANGIAKFSTKGSGFDTLLAVYTGTGMNDLAEVASDEDRAGFYNSEVAFVAGAGTEYLIAIDGLGGSAGSIVLSWNLDPSVSDLPRILEPPLSQTVALGEPVTFSVSAASGSSVTYQWVHNCEVIPGAAGPTLHLENVQAHQLGRYFVFVTDAAGQVAMSEMADLEIGIGALSRNKFQDLFLGPPPVVTLQSMTPKRSSFSSVSAGATGTQLLSNFGASSQLGEPQHAGTLGGASRWFRLRAEADGILEADTVGSEIDTVLAVYTGSDLFSLSPIAGDDNSAPDGVRSSVRFATSAGTDYLAAVDGVNGAQGNITLNWRLGVPPVIVSHPSARSAKAGETVSFTVNATGAPAPEFVWEKNGVPLGQTGSTLTLENVQAGNAGNYRAVAGNFAGTASSEIAALTVLELQAAVRIAGFGLEAGQFEVRMETESGWTYRLEYKNSLSDPAWQPLGSLAGDGTTRVLLDPDPNVPERYYRLRVE